MLVSPKWQTMWLESQHCSKSIVNLHLPSQQTQNLLEDLRISCCSPNKAIQLEALKCWRLWINNQNPDDWKLNAVCFTAVRPLIMKKLQPLQKDVDVFKTKLSLMWALLIKVQNIMQLEGPQYILEVFLQSCLTWLASCGNGCENEISTLIFQLLLAVFEKCEVVSDCDKVLFPSLSTDVLQSKKVFHRLAHKFLDIFSHWRKVQDKRVIIKLWKNFLEHCELSCEHIPIPVWHKIFKLAGQICSEKDAPVKEKLAFLHSCATTLKFSLYSSKFIDFGNLLTTPCEALLKKLVELCTIECNEFCDSEMFLHSKEISQVLSVQSVALGGYDLCIGILDVLEEFSLKSLLWGVWCGLVYCYKVQLLNIDKSLFTKPEIKFYRKLRGVAVNFELDRHYLHKDCIIQVEKHINALNISCSFNSNVESTKDCGDSERTSVLEVDTESQTFQYFNSPSVPQCVAESVSKKIVKVTPSLFCGNFRTVALYNRTDLVLKKVVNIKADLIKDIIKGIGIDSAKYLFSCLFNYRYCNIKEVQLNCMFNTGNLPLLLNVTLDKKTEMSLIRPRLKALPPSHTRVCTPVKKTHRLEDYEEAVSSPKTRSRRKAEEEEKKKESESQKRKKRKSFEVIVQEIVQKNKERKTEKNNRRKSPVMLRSKRSKKKLEKKSHKQTQQTNNEKESESSKTFEQKLRKCRKTDLKTHNKEKKKVIKTDGKLENYFKVITKKSGNGIKKEEKQPKKEKKVKGKTKESSCCNFEKEESERKGEIGWRQTSLKTMMNQKNKMDKIKQGSRTRNKTEMTDEKVKVKKDGKKVNGSPLAKLSPFKEVFHDHEYARIQCEELEIYERILLAKREMGTKQVVSKEELKPKSQRTEEFNHKAGESEEPKPKNLKTKKSDLEKTKAFKANVTEVKNSVAQKMENLNIAKVEELTPSELLTSESIIMQHSTSSDISLTDLRKSENGHILKSPTPEEEQTEVEHSNTNQLLSFAIDNEKLNKSALKLNKKAPESQSNRSDISLQNITGEFAETEVTSEGPRGKKRSRVTDSWKPGKKIKLEDAQEDKFPLEITEKENLEEKQLGFISPTKKDKIGLPVLKNDESPKTVNGTISSRALRMIALVPESTKGSQVQWDSPRVEIAKKKAPNVDKNSRASKMLALLSENVAESEEVDDEKIEEIISSKAVTPKTPVSSLKSPKSIKKRKSIRFDDAKNETVLYQTNTPPSQILEEKERCKRMKPVEFALNFPLTE